MSGYIVYYPKKEVHRRVFGEGLQGSVSGV